MEFFTQQQDILREHLTKPKIENPAEAWMDMGKKQFELWQQTQKQFFSKSDK